MASQSALMALMIISKVEISWNTFLDNYNKEAISTSFIISIESYTISNINFMYKNKKRYKKVK